MKVTRFNKILFTGLIGGFAGIAFFQSCDIGSRSDAIPPDAPGTPGTFSSTARYSITRVFQDGLNGYAGTRDTSVIKEPTLASPIPSSSTAGSYQQIYTRIDSGSNAINILLKFILTGMADQYLKTGETCDSALEVEHAQIEVMGMPAPANSFHSVLPLTESAPDWDETTASWTISSTGVPWPEYSAKPDSPILSSVNLGYYEPVEGVPNHGLMRTMNLNVDRDVAKRWLCHSDQNQGIMIRHTFGAATTTGLTFFSREVPRPAVRPKLIMVISRIGPF